jgi:tetratricopeptide (TPR) repeat protein
MIRPTQRNSSPTQRAHGQVRVAYATQACPVLFCLLIAVMTFVVQAARAETARIVVMDFSVTGDGERWNWARGGMADLLQIQLQQQGLELLDRDLIHSVLSEQRLATAGMTAGDNLAIAKLLNAQFLVTGRVIPLPEERFRVEASVFSVETIESVVAAAGEGRFPNDLSAVLETVAGQIAAGLKSKTAFNPTPQRPGHTPKPESLIMFHRGLDCAARGEPASAVAYFMNAAALDSQFIVPLLWEIKAYEMAGLTNHAALRRQEIPDVLKPLGLALDAPAAVATQSVKRVVAVLSPVVTGVTPSLDPSVVSAEITRALLDKDRVRVFAPEGIGAAVAEQDLKLSSLFDSQFAPRYGRWLVADGLLLCRISATDASQVIVELSLANPMTAAVGPRVKRSGRAGEWQALLRSATDELLDSWASAAPAVEQSTVVAGSATNSTADNVTDLRPIYRALVAALARMQREPGDGGAHRALADAFAATGRPKLAAYEVDLHLKTLDIHAPNADRTFLETHGWAAGSANPQLITNMIGQLLDTYPDSLAAGCLRYNLAVNAWRVQDWPEAVRQAAKSRPILQALISHYDRNAKAEANRGDADCEVAAATYFLEAVGLRKLGRHEEAKAVLRNGLAFMNEYQVRDFCLPYGPMIGDFFGPPRIYGFGGDRPGIKTRLEQELATLNGTAVATNPASAANESVVSTSTPDRPAITWINRADADSQASRYAAALHAYKSALDAGASLGQCGGLRTALAELALERNRDHAVNEVERCRVEFELPPEVVTWVEWFAAGQKYQTSRAFDFEKAAAAYRGAMQFLEDPERGGLFELELQHGSDRIALFWDRRANGFDVRWSELYDARWNNAAYQLAQCLIELGRREEAAQWLRRIALSVGGDDLPLYTSVGWAHENYNTFKLGVLAADQLKELHLSLGQPKFGEAKGPYQTPPVRPRAMAAGSPLPPIAPEVMQALTNTLAECRQAADEPTRREALKSFAAQHRSEVVPAALTLLPVAENPDGAKDLLWLLEQHATRADGPWIVAACQTQWQLIPLANRLDPNATAAALFAEWRALAPKNFIPPDLIYAIANARVRPLFAPVLEQISGKWINHHSVVFLMDRVVEQEKADELTAAFRDALGACLRLKLEQNDRYELARISRIALRRGVPEAVAATVVCESASPEQLRKTLSLYLDLPPGDEAALAFLRTNGSRWEWDAAARKFKPAANKQL